MAVNYVTDNSGTTIAVQVPIDEWKRIKNKYPDVDDLDDDSLPDWQKKLIDKRLEAIISDPERLKPIDDLFENEE